MLFPIGIFLNGIFLFTQNLGRTGQDGHFSDFQINAFKTTLLQVEHKKPSLNNKKTLVAKV